MTEIEWTFESGSETWAAKTSLISEVAGVGQCSRMFPEAILCIRRMPQLLPVRLLEAGADDISKHRSSCAVNPVACLY